MVARRFGDGYVDLMRMWPVWTVLLLVAACSARESEPPPAGAAARVGYTASDVRFMQGMIGHHGQALTMTALVAGRSSRPDFGLLAERIAVSQRDEIAFMKNWLRRRNEALPDPDAEAHAALGHGDVMPGMLSQAELDALTRATGLEFERLFLTYMIKHHEGAIRMVSQLFATAGAGQEPELFLFATDVNADQESEIKRMRALLATLR